MRPFTFTEVKRSSLFTEQNGMCTERSCWLKTPKCVPMWRKIWKDLLGEEGMRRLDLSDLCLTLCSALHTAQGCFWNPMVIKSKALSAAPMLPARPTAGRPARPHALQLPGPCRLCSSPLPDPVHPPPPARPSLCHAREEGFLLALGLCSGVREDGSRLPSLDWVPGACSQHTAFREAIPGDLTGFQCGIRQKDAGDFLLSLFK